MITMSEWFPQVVELFNDILWTLMEQPVFGVLLTVLLFLIMAGLFAWLIYLGRKGRL